MKKITLFASLAIACQLIISNFSLAQNAQYYDNHWVKITNKDSAAFRREVVQEGENYLVTDYSLPSGVLFAKSVYRDKKLKTRNGKYEEFHPNGNLYKSENYVDGKLEGKATWYWPDKAIDAEMNYVKGNLHGENKWYHSNGKIASVEEYAKGTILRVKFWDEKGAEIAAQVGDVIKAPYYMFQPNGAQRYLYSKILFPEAARYLSESSRCMLNFTIGADGKVLDVFVELSADNILDAESMRVAKEMPNWTPGKFHNRPYKFENVNVDIFYKLVMVKEVNTPTTR